jgi:hypothetical protein
LGVTSFGKIN